MLCKAGKGKSEGKNCKQKAANIFPSPPRRKTFRKTISRKEKGRVGVQRAVAKWTGDRGQGEEGEERGGVGRDAAGLRGYAAAAKLRENPIAGYFYKLLRVDYSSRKARIA